MAGLTVDSLAEMQKAMVQDEKDLAEKEAVEETEIRLLHGTVPVPAIFKSRAPEPCATQPTPDPHPVFNSLLL